MIHLINKLASRMRCFFRGHKFKIEILKNSFSAIPEKKLFSDCERCGKKHEG